MFCCLYRRLESAGARTDGHRELDAALVYQIVEAVESLRTVSAADPARSEILHTFEGLVKALAPGVDG